MPKGKEQLGDKLKAQEIAKVEKWANVDQEELMAAHLRHSKKEGGLVRSRLIARFKKQAEKITKEVERIQAQHEREMRALEANHYLNLHAKSMEALMARFDTVIRGHGGDDAEINTEGEAISLGIHGEKMLKAFDARNIVAKSRMSFQVIEDSMEIDHIDLIRELNENPVITPKQWDDVIVPHLLSLMKGKGGSQLDRCVGVQMMTYMDAPERMTFMRKIAKKENGADIMMAMYRGNFVTQIQVDMVAEEFLKSKQGAKMLTLREKIKDPRILKQKEITAQRMQAREGIIGHRNTTKSLLTVGGVGGTILAANGALTVFVNVAANLGTGDVISAVANPGHLLGFTEMAVGAVASKGGGGLMPAPLEAGSMLTRGKEVKQKEREEVQNTVMASMMDDFANNPEYAKVYYGNANDIAKTFKEKADAGISSQGMTLAEMKIDPEELAKKGLNPIATEKQLNKWAKRFVSNEGGFTRTSGESQINFIDKTYLKNVGKTMESIIGLT